MRLIRRNGVISIALPEAYRRNALKRGIAMKRNAFVVFILLGIMSAFAIPITYSSPSPPIVLVNGTVVDGTGSPAIADAVLIIQEEKILAVGLRSQIPIPPDAQIIDLQGGTILPGFINAHVHEGFNESNLKAWAQAGVTTVRDLGNGGPRSEIFALRDRLSKDPQNARLIAAGPMVTVPDGYPDVYWGGGGLIVESPADARKKAEQLLDDGADIIKVSLETGGVFGMVGGNSWPILSADELVAIVETAHRRGTRVSAHVTNWPQLKLALGAGVDEIAHIVTSDVSDVLIQQMVKQNVIWIPTFELMATVRPPNARTILFNNLRRFVTAGGIVTLGTDFAGERMKFQLGMPIIEMEFMQAAGMTPMQIITAATKNAAVSCNRGNQLGTLEKGKIADIIIVRGNPLNDIHVLENVEYVFRNGIPIRTPK